MTRYRYGDEQHLDEALTRIFQFGRQQGIPRRLRFLARKIPLSIFPRGAPVGWHEVQQASGGTLNGVCLCNVTG